MLLNQKMRISLKMLVWNKTKISISPLWREHLHFCPADYFCMFFVYCHSTLLLSLLDVSEPSLTPIQNPILYTCLCHFCFSLMKYDLLHEIWSSPSEDEGKQGRNLFSEAQHRFAREKKFDDKFQLEKHYIELADGSRASGAEKRRCGAVFDWQRGTTGDAEERVVHPIAPTGHLLC